MNYIGGYHTELKVRGVCDAPFKILGRAAIGCANVASDADGMAMVFGTMNNHAALIRELDCPRDAGCAYVALNAYRCWGDDFAKHIEGACVCCVTDREADRLLLTRDRMGECCLFYAVQGDRMVFSDHPDSILKCGFLQPVIDRTAACEIFGLGPARTPGRTMLAGLESLPAGCMLLCDGGKIEMKRYYSLEARLHKESESATVEHTRALLDAAVDACVGLHPGTMLSGGLDSTALTALLRKRLGRVESYSVDYEGNDRDFVSNAFRPEMDAPYINLAVQSLGTRHFSCAIGQRELADALEAAMRARGFPGMGDIDASLLIFAERIARRSPAVISGECGDEVFGGYPWFQEGFKFREDIFPWSGSMELRNAVLRKDVAQKLNIDAYVRERLEQSLDSYDVSAIEDADERRRFRLQRLCFDYFMPNLQERAVRMCESAGLKVLTPLCNVRLVEYVYNVPWKMKNLGGMEKGLFRAAVEELLPEKLRKRKKSPYPKTCSPVYANLVRDRMGDLIRDKSAPVWQLADRDFMERYATSALNPAETPWFGQLMAGPQLLAYILQIDVWMRERRIAVEL